MRLTDGILAIIYERLTDALFTNHSETDINEVLLFLTRWNDSTKLVPYGVYNSDGIIPYATLIEDEESKTFVKWLDSSTSNIEKPFNKSRKLARLIKDISDKRLVRGRAYWMGVSFISLLSSFFIDMEKEDAVSSSFWDIGSRKEVLKGIKCYVSTILQIELIDSDEKIEEIMAVLILSDTQRVFEGLSQIGIK